MNMKKLMAAFTAASMAVTMSAVSAFAATVTLNSEYTGAWSASATIPKAEFEAIGGDVKVVLEVERKDPLVGEGNYLLKPMNICVSWDAITDQLTSDTAVAKTDGFFVVGKDVTSVEFVVPESTWSEFKGYVDDEGNEDESAGLAFQVNDVIIKSAELSSGAPEAEIKRVTEEESAEIMKNGVAATEEEAAPAEDEAAADEATEEVVEDAAADETVADDAAVEEVTEAAAEVTEAPAADTTTAPAATGNTAAASIAVVMVAAGAAALISKRK